MALLSQTSCDRDTEMIVFEQPWYKVYILPSFSKQDKIMQL